MQAFGDGFDLYATTADMVAGYWDTSSLGANMTLQPGRFSGSQCIRFVGAMAIGGQKSSGANDALHHLVFAFQQTATLSGTTAGLFFQLSDVTTAQCSVVFRSDGAILLTSGGPTGTTLATYTGAVTAANTWFAFEIEVFISATAGYMNVRKNGNTSNDFTSATNLNTRAGTNNYANRITFSQQVAVANQLFDDFLWRSDPAAVPWVGDVRCYTRMPASDAQAQFSRSPAVSAVVPFAATTTLAVAAGRAQYTAFTATYDGAIGTAVITMGTGYTGNLKCSIFASSGGVPTSVLGSATTLANPATGTNTITFPTPVPVAKATPYFIGVDSDTSSGTFSCNASVGSGLSSTTAYAAFPAASPSTTTGNGNATNWTINITVGSNTTLVNETLEDGATSYVYDSNPGDADFYNIGTLAATPVSVVAVTTRGFFEKSDAGTRNAAVQLKSGATTVQSTSTALSSSWGWLYRTDLTDPNTGSAWTPTAVNGVQIGPITTA